MSPMNKRVIGEVIENISGIAEDRGYKILPSTKSKIKLSLAKATTRGLIKDKHEVTLGAAGLISAGIVTASQQERKHTRVRVRDIDDGYQNMLREEGSIVMGPGNHAPHNCILRTVIAREKELRHSMPMFAGLLKNLGE